MSRRWLWAMALLVVVAAGGACASGLDVRYPEAGARPALLASITPRRVALGPVTDRRRDTSRIGTKPDSQDPIRPRRPVEAIVREALAVEIARNGHAVVGDGGDVALTVDVEEFWLDAARWQGTPQYIGRVAIALAVIDTPTGRQLLARRYVGITRRQGEPDAERAWRETMDTALARTVHDIATDPGLVEALARR